MDHTSNVLIRLHRMSWTGLLTGTGRRLASVTVIEESARQGPWQRGVDLSGESGHPPPPVLSKVLGGLFKPDGLDGVLYQVIPG